MKPGTQELEEVVMFDRRGPPGCLRILTPDEVWRLQGRSKIDAKEESVKDRGTIGGGRSCNRSAHRKLLEVTSCT